MEAVGAVVDDSDARGTDFLHPAPGVSIPLTELVWRYSTSGGPGGQHANTSQTRADVRFDIAGSPSLSERHRHRLVSRLGSTVEAGAGERRSQARNRQLALERLAARIEVALIVERPRRATRPTLGSTRRRLDAKRRQGERKRDRQNPPDE